MPSSGPNSGGTFANDTSFGGNAWTGASNAASSNDSRATATVTGSGSTTNYLKATNFGFSIPAGATIDGIVVEWECSVVGNAKDGRVRIVKGGTIGSTDKSKPEATPWSTGADAYRSYGASNDLWGETWDADAINNSGFGAVMAAEGFFGAGDPCKIDHVRITVYYTTAGKGKPLTRKATRFFRRRY